MAAHGHTAPTPLPSNRHAWAAFLRVCHIRHYPMGQAHMPNWTDIATVLDLYGLWDTEVQMRLSVCFTELLTMEAEQRKTENG